MVTMEGWEDAGEGKRKMVLVLFLSCFVSLPCGFALRVLGVFERECDEMGWSEEKGSLALAG